MSGGWGGTKEDIREWGGTKKLRRVCEDDLEINTCVCGVTKELIHVCEGDQKVNICVWNQGIHTWVRRRGDQGIHTCGGTKKLEHVCGTKDI